MRERPVGPGNAQPDLARRRDHGRHRRGCGLARYPVRCGSSWGGHKALRDCFRELWSYSEASEFQVEEIRAVGERVLAFFVITAIGEQGIETSVRAAGVYDLEHGKIRRAHIYADRTEALEAVGLTE